MSTCRKSPENPLAHISDAQRQHLADLLDAERAFISRWWTHLNEMRARGELPDWAIKNGVGTGPDHDQWWQACGQTNQALFGKRRDIRAAYEMAPQEAFIAKGESLLESIERRNSVRVLGEVKQPGSVRQHRPGKATLGSTNVRNQS
jgi:hypothetical protein